MQRFAPQAARLRACPPPTAQVLGAQPQGGTSRGWQPPRLQPSLPPQPALPGRAHDRITRATPLKAAKSDPFVTPEYTSKQELVHQLLSAKEASGKSFTQIGRELGLTNMYTAQLFHNQAQLKAGTEPKLRAAVPALTDAQVAAMRRCPMRSFDPAITQEPHIYRLTEAVLHYGEAIKAIMNEELGDGIMSAIDMYSDVKVIQGVQGEKRVCITLNGKFLPHVEQLEENNTAPK